VTTQPADPPAHDTPGRRQLRIDYLVTGLVFLGISAGRAPARGRDALPARGAGTIEVAQVDEDLDRLTEREREVMRLIARGYAYKEVAASCSSR
jgi:hypothetical protein